MVGKERYWYVVYVLNEVESLSIFWKGNSWSYEIISGVFVGGYGLGYDIKDGGDGIDESRLYEFFEFVRFDLDDYWKV